MWKNLKLHFLYNLSDKIHERNLSLYFLNHLNIVDEKMIYVDLLFLIEEKISLSEVFFFLW
jgi:hypothetical protein